jgi:hypothetical protein
MFRCSSNSVGLEIVDQFWLCRIFKLVSYKNLIALYSVLETEAAGKRFKLIASTVYSCISQGMPIQ